MYECYEAGLKYEIIKGLSIRQILYVVCRIYLQYIDVLISIVDGSYFECLDKYICWDLIDSIKV